MKQIQITQQQHTNQHQNNITHMLYQFNEYRFYFDSNKLYLKKNNKKTICDINIKRNLVQNELFI